MGQGTANALWWSMVSASSAAQAAQGLSVVTILRQPMEFCHHKRIINEFQGFGKPFEQRKTLESKKWSNFRFRTDCHCAALRYPPHSRRGVHFSESRLVMYSLFFWKNIFKRNGMYLLPWSWSWSWFLTAAVLSSQLFIQMTTYAVTHGRCKDVKV